MKNSLFSVSFGFWGKWTENSLLHFFSVCLSFFVSVKFSSSKSQYSNDDSRLYPKYCEEKQKYVLTALHYMTGDRFQKHIKTLGLLVLFSKIKKKFSSFSQFNVVLCSERLVSTYYCEQTCIFYI